MKLSAIFNNQILDLAENRAERGITTNMQEWIRFLNHFPELSQYPILTGRLNAYKETKYKVLLPLDTKNKFINIQNI
jgi:hypothetical protein